MLREGIEKAWERLAEGLVRPEMVRESPRRAEKAPREPEKAPRAFSGYCKMLQRFVDSSNTQLHPSARQARPPPQVRLV